jgi:hypothetical protein
LRSEHSAASTSVSYLLKNEPFHPMGIHGGQSVDVKEEDVLDYIRHFPDGHEEGNTTSELIRRMNEKKEQSSPQISVPCADDPNW